MGPKGWERKHRWSAQRKIASNQNYMKNKGRESFCLKHTEGQEAMGNSYKGEKEGRIEEEKRGVGVKVWFCGERSR